MSSSFFENPNDNTITIYNQKSDDTYQRTIITNVYIRRVRKSIVNSKGEEVASNLTIIIPSAYAKIDGNLAIKSYLNTRMYDKQKAILNFTLNQPLLNRAWTLIPGDYIVDKKCEKEFSLRELKKDYKVYRLESIADNRKGNLQHFKLEAME